MALVATTSQELASLFDTQVQQKVVEIYTAIPGSLVKYLEKKDVVKRIQFRQDFAAAQVQMGTAKKVNFADFEQAFRRTIKNSFDAQHVIEVRSEDLSRDLVQEYQSKVIARPNKGDSVTTIITLDKPYQKKEGALWTTVSAHIYLYLTEECENNWFATDKRKFSYEMTVEVNGISVDKTKAVTFCQLVKENDADVAIAEIKQRFALSWDDL